MKKRNIINKSQEYYQWISAYYEISYNWRHLVQPQKIHFKLSKAYQKIDLRYKLLRIL